MKPNIPFVLSVTLALVAPAISPAAENEKPIPPPKVERERREMRVLTSPDRIFASRTSGSSAWVKSHTIGRIRSAACGTSAIARTSRASRLGTSRNANATPSLTPDVTQSWLARSAVRPTNVQANVPAVSRLNNESRMTNEAVTCCVRRRRDRCAPPARRGRQWRARACAHCARRSPTCNAALHAGPVSRVGAPFFPGS